MYLGEKQTLEFLSRRWESSAKNKEVQIYSGTERYRMVQRVTEVQRYIGTGRSRATEVQKGTEVQRGTKILRGTERYSSAGDREVQVMCATGAVPGEGRGVQPRTPTMHDDMTIISA